MLKSKSSYKRITPGALISLAACVAASLACATLGVPASTPAPTLPAPVRWQAEAGSSTITPPALADGLLVYLTAQQQVFALDAATGQQKWHYDLYVTDQVHRPLSIANGVVLLENDTAASGGKSVSNVLGLDLHTGKLLWQTRLSPEEDTLFFYQPSANNGVAYFESETGPGGRQLTAADPATGQVKWQAPFTGTALAGDPAFDGDRMFVPFDHPDSVVTAPVLTDLAALDAATGARQWTAELGSLAMDILAAGDGRVFVTTKDGTCWAFDGATGKVDWKFQFNNDKPAPPRLAGDTLYLGDGQGQFYALDAASGQQKWTAQLGVNVIRRATLGGGRLYVGSGDGNLNALDPASGQVLWQIRNLQETPFASNPYIPPQDTEPLYDSGTLVFPKNSELIALQVP
jgi:outer membrane protein assembly factor BamB